MLDSTQSCIGKCLQLLVVFRIWYVTDGLLQLSTDYSRRRVSLEPLPESDTSFPNSWLYPWTRTTLGFFYWSVLCRVPWYRLATHHWNHSMIASCSLLWFSSSFYWLALFWKIAEVSCQYICGRLSCWLSHRQTQLISYLVFLKMEARNMSTDYHNS